MRRFLIFLPFLAIVVIWCGTWYFVPDWYPTHMPDGTEAKYKFESPGIFGDMFGAINALFTGLAFAGTVVALILQAEQIRRQSEEQIRQREEQVELREAMEEFADLKPLRPTHSLVWVPPFISRIVGSS